MGNDAITNCDGRDWGRHHEASKRSRNTMAICLQAINGLTDNNYEYIFKLHWGSKWLLRNDRLVNAMITLHVMSQEVTTSVTTFDCYERTRSCKQQSTFFINVDQPHWQLQGVKRQQEDWLQGHDANVGDATFISHCHIAWSNDIMRK